MTKKQPVSLQEIIRRRQASGFIGRQAQLGAFEANLQLAVDDPRRNFLFSVHGDAGIGKTFLLHQFVRIAREQGCLTAYSDESSYDIPSVLETMTSDMNWTTS